MNSHPGYEIHSPEALPLLEGEALDALPAHIRANGLITPITVLGGKTLDGRNRMRACRGRRRATLRGHQGKIPMRLFHLGQHQSELMRRQTLMT